MSLCYLIDGILVSRRRAIRAVLFATNDALTYEGVGAVLEKERWMKAGHEVVVCEERASRRRPRTEKKW